VEAKEYTENGLFLAILDKTASKNGIYKNYK